MFSAYNRNYPQNTKKYDASAIKFKNIIYQKI